MNVLLLECGHWRVLTTQDPPDASRFGCSDCTRQGDTVTAERSAYIARLPYEVPLRAISEWRLQEDPPEPQQWSECPVCHRLRVNCPGHSPSPVYHRCSNCGVSTNDPNPAYREADIKALYYRHPSWPTDAGEGMSYPLCKRCRPEQEARLARHGFVDIVAR